MKNYKRYRLLEIGETTMIGDQYLTIHGNWFGATAGYVVHITFPTVIRREDDGKGTWVLLNNEENFGNGDQLFNGGVWKVIGSMLPVGTNCANIRRKRKMTELDIVKAQLEAANARMSFLEEVEMTLRKDYEAQILNLKAEISMKDDWINATVSLINGRNIF